MTVRLASCSCGQLQAEVRGDPIDVSSVTATLANAEPAAFLARRRSFLASPCPSRAMARSLSGSETKAQDSSSPSALNAGRRSSTSRKGMNNRSPFLWGPLRTHTFQPQRSRSTRSAGIRGSLFPTMSSAGARIRYSPAPSGQAYSSCTGPAHTRHHLILWCYMDIGPVGHSRATIAHRMAAARPGRMRPIPGRLSIPVLHTFASANYRERSCRAVAGGTRTPNR